MFNNRFILSFFIITLLSFKIATLPVEFSELLSRAKMGFTQPKNFTEVFIIPNKQLHYDYALTYPNRKFEVRFLVKPMDNLIAEYEEKERNKKPGTINIHPNKSYFVGMQATLFNLAGGKHVEITELSKAVANSEFNADWAAFAWLVPVGDFASGFAFCKVVAIHKDNTGDAYYFYLMNSKTGFDDLMIPLNHVMKFE